MTKKADHFDRVYKIRHKRTGIFYASTGDSDKISKYNEKGRKFNRECFAKSCMKHIQLNEEDHEIISFILIESTF